MRPQLVRRYAHDAGFSTVDVLPIDNDMWLPLPLPTSFGGREAYVDQLGVQLKSCDPVLFLFPAELADFCKEAADKGGVASRDWESLSSIEPASAELHKADPNDIAGDCKVFRGCLQCLPNCGT